jgi:streptomycin 6-kinase
MVRRTHVKSWRPFPLPTSLVEAARQEHREGWLDGLPALVSGLARRWSLILGEPFQPGGQTAWVAPARSAAWGDVVLKVEWRHPEATQEADGLRVWNGRGAVRLHGVAEGDDFLAFVIERCVPGIQLSRRPEAEQDAVVAGLLLRLWQAPPDGFRPLRQMCSEWADAFTEKQTPLDPGIVCTGAALFRTLPATADRCVLLCTDLHAGNVLAAEREPWLVIDPKPYAGDPTYDALQHILNCDGRLHADPHSLARRMADLLGLDAGRLLQWLFARCVVESADWPGLAAVAERLAP